MSSTKAYTPVDRSSSAHAPPWLEPGRVPQGTLGPGDVGRLVAGAVRDEFTGQILISEAGGAARTLYFRRGRLARATSTDPLESFPAYLVRVGRVPAEHEALEMTADSSSIVSVAARLVNADCIAADEVSPLIGCALEEIFVASVGVLSGYFAVRTQSVNKGEVYVQTETRQLLVDAIRFKWGDRESKAVLARFSPNWIDGHLRTPYPVQLEHALSLSDYERALLARCDGGPIASVVSADAPDGVSDAPEGATKALPLLAGLALVEYLAIEPPHDSLEAPQEEAPLRMHVENKYQQVQFGDYFTLLGLRLDATQADVNNAYHRQLKVFDAEALPGAIREEFAFELDEIHEVLREAHGILRIESLRAAYRKAIGDAR